MYTQHVCICASVCDADVCMWRLEANLSCLSSGDIHFLLLVFVVEPLTSSKLVKLAQLAISTCLCITQGWDYKCIPPCLT